MLFEFCTLLDRYGSPAMRRCHWSSGKRPLGLLLSQLKDGVLLWGSLTIVADEIGVARSTISRLWGQAHGACKESVIITPEITSQNNSCVNALKYSHAEFQPEFEGNPLASLQNISFTAKPMGVSLNTVQRMLLQRDVCYIHTSSLKPTLMDENKVSRMELALSSINRNDTSKFEHMEDLIHTDKKWFYLTKDGQCFIIVAEEAEP